MLDCAIIGTGPAGLSAALNLKLHNKDFIWFGSKTMSAKVQLSEKIANYPGVGMVSGEELNDAFRKQAEEAGLTITDRMVSQIMPMGDSFMLLADNETCQVKTLILALGVVSGRTIPGEDALLGRGVSYCATCDGFLYKGKNIGVFCAAPRFAHEVHYLAELADRLWLFPGYNECHITCSNIVTVEGKITAVNGEKKLTSVTVAGEEIPLDGLFILREAIAPSTLLPGLAVEKGQITVDRTMATNIPGCFACGDCTGTPYQLTKAVGEGNIAAHSVLKYLSAK